MSNTNIQIDTIGSEEDYESFLEEQRQKMSSGNFVSFGDKKGLFEMHQNTMINIENKLQNIGNLKKMISQFEWDMKTYVSKFQFAVTKEVDAGNVPKYKNRESRDAEVKARLRECEPYNKLREMSEDTADQLLDVEHELIVLKNKLKFCDTWAGM